MEFIETFRAVVAPWQCDQHGHMNVQFHMAAVSDAAFQMMVPLGLGTNAPRDPPVSIIAVHMEFDFSSELNAGDAYFVETAIEAVGTKSLTYRHRMKNAATGALAMESKVVGACMNLESRLSCPLPADVAEKARELSAGGAAA